MGARFAPYIIFRNLGKEIFIMRKEINVIQDYADLFKQFGLRYFTFRISYELSKKLGLLKSKFPSSYLKSTYPKLETWKKMPHNFFVSAKEDIKIFDNEYSSQLQSEVRKILNGEVLYFFKDWKDLGFDKEWNIHPLTKHHYDLEHWSKLPMYSKEIGDIKYVWEKSKFSYLIYLIRNDLRHQEDHSEFVFNEISRWIDENPPNLGPQYICSQEISIRLLNWSFALFFYKNSKNLNDDLLEKIFSSIEIQIEHVYNNINFSRISVRNNHSVTETLTLYLISLFFPFFKDAKKYKENGKKWFEEEIEYQIFDDGSDSQYSFNYHRVKIQLFSWAISSAKVNNEVLSNKIIEKAKKSLYFLTSMMANTEKGLLPNFGANDGSIYFKLSDADYQDFYPQLNALAALLNIDIPLTRKNKASDEDKFWFTQKFHIKPDKKVSLAPFDNFTHYKNGGYVQIRDNNTFTLFKTPELSFRAGQMDLFHIDIWVNGENILLDKGSYSYNTDEETLMSFNASYWYEIRSF